MGNCQAIDAASLVIQHPNGKVDKMYWPVSATQVMKLNPGHYVALLITTTISHTKTDNNHNNNNNNKSPTKPSNNFKNTNITSAPKTSNINSNSKGSDSSITGRNSVRITRVKLLRPKDTLALGHVYRLITTQEVMKGLVAKKQAKMRKNGIELADSEGLRDAEKLVKFSVQDKSHQVISRHGQRSRTTSGGNGGGTARPKTWQPSLNSISEAAS
ncbi:hypothetical protein RND81_10G224700 [Saponaria officinalis]|uniref:Uncharacterized protein n=1 Tax=Saponaria officinalis TaxID=3572 RepID=A0AAW1I711_SAPOF